eukprot:764850-Hanusia_phi.AAC.4
MSCSRRLDQPCDCGLEVAVLADAKEIALGEHLPQARSDERGAKAQPPRAHVLRVDFTLLRQEPRAARIHAHPLSFKFASSSHRPRPTAMPGHVNG